jgi:hypothetical protein
MIPSRGISLAATICTQKISSAHCKDYRIGGTNGKTSGMDRKGHPRAQVLGEEGTGETDRWQVGAVRRCRATKSNGTGNIARDQEAPTKEMIPN